MNQSKWIKLGSFNEMAKTINKNVQNLFLLIHQMKDLNLEKSRSSRKVNGRRENDRSLFKKIRGKGYPDPIDPAEKKVFA